MLSIIVPTLNEEDYLPLLLESIKRQSFSDYEIIVADAGSTDATLEIAEKYHCKIVPGGLPARGRNNGARAATGDILFFLDADTILPDEFLSKALEEFNRRGLSIAGFALRPYPKNRITFFIIDLFYNKMIVALEKILPHAAMGILIRKEPFEKLNGYNEEITLGEDYDMVGRSKKYATFGAIRSTEIIFSDRRFRKEGWLSVGVKYFLCGLHILFIGSVKTDIFKYKFGHYKEKNN